MENISDLGVTSNSKWSETENPSYSIDLDLKRIRTSESREKYLTAIVDGLSDHLVRHYDDLSTFVEISYNGPEHALDLLTSISGKRAEDYEEEFNKAVYLRDEVSHYATVISGVSIGLFATAVSYPPLCDASVSVANYLNNWNSLVSPVAALSQGIMSVAFPLATGALSGFIVGTGMDRFLGKETQKYVTLNHKKSLSCKSLEESFKEIMGEGESKLSTSS